MKFSNLKQLLENTKKEGDCLVFTGIRYPKTGYGQCYIGTRGTGKPIYTGAHRLRWQFEFGKIPKGFYVLHSCDNPPCVKLSHLRLGTPQDNMDDRSKRNPYCGSGHHNATTDENTVRTIRQTYKNCSKKYGSVVKIAKKFGLSFRTTYQIIHNYSWRHIL